MEGVISESMYRITKLIQTCTACPSQWSGETDKGEEVYIRYRHGYLYIEVNGERIFERSYGDKLDGFMPYDELTTFALDRVEWPTELSLPEQEEDDRV